MVGSKGTSLNPAELDDRALMEQVADKRQTALEELYDRHANLVYSFAMRMLGESDGARELVQEVFLRVWRQGATAPPEREAFVTWLLSLTHAQGIDVLRRRRSRPQRADHHANQPEDGEVSASVPDLQASTEQDSWTADRRKRIREALQALPKDQRRTIELSYFQGYTQEEIARLTGDPLGIVKSRLRLGLRKLRDLLGSEGKEVGSV